MGEMEKMYLNKQALAMLAGVAFAIFIAAPATADMRAPGGGRLILAQDNQELSEEELRRLKRKERREQKQERQRQEKVQQKQERRERQRAEQDERKKKAQERRARQRAKKEKQEKRIHERRERQRAKREEQEERKRKRRARLRAEQEKQEKRIRQRREKQKAEQEEREERRQERRKRKRAQTDEREEFLERLEEERKRKLEEAEERRIRREERRRNERADQEEKRRERAKQITEQQEDERRERRARRLERIEGGELSQEERNERRRVRRKFTREKLGDIKRARRKRREAGGRVIIEEPDNRRIIRKGKRVIIENDDSERLRGAERDVKVKRGPRGRTRTVITRPNGVQIITVRNRDGDVIRRIKRLRNGRKIVLFNNEPRRRRHTNRSRRDDYNGFGFFIDLPDLRVTAPRSEYYVYADEADEGEIEDILTAEPLEEFEEEYTLEEIRYSPDIRARLRRLNVNTVNFDFGSWEIREDQYDKLEVVARVIKRIVERKEDEIFLLAGHTDAVGSDEDNLSLSDRRAETVARILTDEFDVPPENLVTQGYGESDLLVDTQSAKAANRRVEFMRITPALAQYDE